MAGIRNVSLAVLSTSFNHPTNQISDEMNVMLIPPL